MNGINGLAIGTDGSVYTQNGFVQKVDYATGIITGYVGTSACAGDPLTITLISGGDGMLNMDAANNLYLFGQVCTGGLKLLKVTPAKVVSIVAAVGSPNYLTRDAAGNMYYTDNVDSVALKVDAAGTITTIAGIKGPAPGPGAPDTPDYVSAAATVLNWPRGIAVLPNGHIVIGQGYSPGLRFLW